MRTLLILFPFFFSFSLMSEAASLNSSNVENIELNIKDHEMAMTFMGLSSGEATLIQGPDNQTILVGIGGKDSVEELKGWLKLYDVKTVHTLILTKKDQNLSGGRLNKLITAYNIQQIITFPGAYTEEVKQIANQNQVPINVWNQSMKSELLPELTAEVQFAGNQQDEGLDFTLDFYTNRILLLSSSSLRAEEALLTRDLGNITVLKIPESGRDASLSEELITYLNPEISILFTTEDSKDSELIANLHETWSEVYSTKRHGTVTIKFTESKYEIFTIPTAKE